MKAKRGILPLAKLIGAHRDAVPCYDTCGGLLKTPVGSAAYARGPWLEHFDWLTTFLEEQIASERGCRIMPKRPALGLTPSERSLGWKVAEQSVVASSPTSIANWLITSRTEPGPGRHRGELLIDWVSQA